MRSSHRDVVADGSPATTAYDTFVHTLQTSGLASDLTEHSFAVGPDDLSLFRRSEYFNVRARGSHEAEHVLAMFERLAGSLGVHLSDCVRGWLSPEAMDGALQIAIGIDDRDNEQTRLKFYLICDQRPCAARENAFEILHVDPSTFGGVENAHIVGLDLTHDGLHDVKLYYALNKALLSRVLRPRYMHSPLVNHSKHVVLQASVLQDRGRRMHIISDSCAVVENNLAERVSETASGLVTDRLRQIEQTEGVVLKPWIGAYDFDKGHLSESAFSVYFHPQSREPEPARVAR